MIYRIQKPVSDLQTFHKQLVETFSTFVGLNSDGDVVDAEFYTELTDVEINNLLSIEPKQKIQEIPSVTPRQIRQALILKGVNLSVIENAIDSLPEPQKSLARVEWEYSTAFERHRPLVQQVALVLNWTPTQVDDLWILAKTL